jgi:uncharacterized protein YbaR (Trm112 family)
MSLDKYIKDADYVHVCPFCSKELAINEDKYYENHGQVGYECLDCSIPGVNTFSGKKFSRYNIGVMKNVHLTDRVYDQIIVEETFYIHFKDNQWYNVSNNLPKSQTVLVLTEPSRPEHMAHISEKAYGLVWVSNLAMFQFIDTWDLTDQEKTLSKIRTYLVFS